MGRATVEAWERRKELAAALASLGTASAAVLGILGERVEAAASLFAGLAAAAITFAIELGRTAAARRREAARMHELTYVDILPVDQVDPTAIGVDPASREVTQLAGDVPDYLPRDADRELEEALREALDRTGRWIVVIPGLPKVGKSRTLFEGLLRINGDGYELRLVAPTDAASLRALLEQIEPPRRGGARNVLWLDDIETFVAEDVGLKELQAWHRKDAIVVGTYGGKGSERDFGPDAEWIGALGDKIMSLARQVGMQATTAEELARLPESLSGVSREAIDQYGLAAALVAAPALDLKLRLQQHGTGGPKSPAGAAIAYTVINWALCGRTDPIPEEQLRRLWPGHLEDNNVASDPDGFEAGLEWALEPIAGRIALLERVAGGNAFRAFDYVRSSAARNPSTPPISEETWRQALDTDDPGQAFGVGVAAHAAKRMRDAERALRLAASDEDSQIAGSASFNLGVLFEERKEHEKAEEAYRRAAELGSPTAVARLNRPAVEAAAVEEVEGPPPAVREAIERQLSDEGMLDGEAEMKWGEDVYRDEIARGDGAAAGQLGLAMMGRGEPEEAEAMLRKALELGFPPAALSLGALLEERKDTAGAEAAYREAMENDIAEGAFNLGVLLKDKGDIRGSEEALRRAAQLGFGPAASNLGFLLERRGDLAGAENAYREAVQRGFAPAAVGLGSLLERRGRTEEAEKYLRQAAVQGEMGGAVALARLLLEQGRKDEARDAFKSVAAADETDAALLFAVVLEELGDYEEAEAAYREAMGHGVDIAAYNLGRLLESQGRHDEAKEAFEQAEELEEDLEEEDSDPDED